MDQKKIILDFLRSEKHMVMATESNGIPQAALMGFCEMEDLSLIIGTDTTSRKFQNLQNNSRVALVFGKDGEITVQYEAIASVLIGQQLLDYKAKYFMKQPEAKKYEADPNQIYIKILPVWIRYTDYTKEPAEIFEVQL